MYQEPSQHPRSSAPSDTADMDPNRKTVVLDINETLLSSSWWTTEMKIGDQIEEKSGTSALTVVSIFDEVTHPKSQAKDRTFEFQDNLSLTKWIQSDYDLALTKVSCQGEDNRLINISKDNLDKNYQPYFHSLFDLNNYNLRRPLSSPASFCCNGAVVRLRPYLGPFLEFVCKSFHVILFTAAEEQTQRIILEYMQQALAQYVKSNLQFDQVLFRSDCDETESGFHKNIHKLGVSLSHLVMIDDNHDSFEGFEGNVIPIRPFYGCRGRDEELLRIGNLLMLMVSFDGDVRCRIKELLDRQKQINNSIRSRLEQL